MKLDQRNQQRKEFAKWINSEIITAQQEKQEKLKIAKLVYQSYLAFGYTRAAVVVFLNELKEAEKIKDYDDKYIYIKESE